MRTDLDGCHVHACVDMVLLRYRHAYTSVGMAPSVIWASALELELKLEPELKPRPELELEPGPLLQQYWLQAMTLQAPALQGRSEPFPRKR